MTLLAVDPGTEKSGWVEMVAEGDIRCAVDDNHFVLEMIAAHSGELAIEMVASYGMAVGREVFETVRWIGRFQQAYKKPDSVRFIYRKDVKMHLCQSMKAKDANIRQAIIDLYGGKDKAIGTKKSPGVLYSVKSHAWPALAVALTARVAA